MHKYTIRLIATALLLLSTSGMISAAEQGKAGKKERKQLQGTWVAKKGDVSAVMTIKGKRFTFKMDDGSKKATASGTYTIDASKDPKTIDMKITKGKGDVEKYIGKTSLGIYKLKGDALTWCASEPGDATRPTMFSADGERHLQLMFERKKD